MLKNSSTQVGYQCLNRFNVQRHFLAVEKEGGERKCHVRKEDAEQTQNESLQSFYFKIPCTLMTSNAIESLNKRNLRT